MNTTANQDTAPALGPLHLNIKIVPINTKIGIAERITFIRLRSGPILLNIEYPSYFKEVLLFMIHGSSNCRFLPL